MDRTNLGEAGLTVERLVQMDAQQQSGDQVSISNSIASLRLLSATDWREFVELLSHVEQVLCTDPAAVYSNMDFATRDRYRHVVERLARHCLQSETQVAQAAIELASKPAPTAASERTCRAITWWLTDYRPGASAARQRAAARSMEAPAAERSIEILPVPRHCC